MKPILYHQKVPVFKEYRFLYPVNKIVDGNTKIGNIKRWFKFWIKMIGFSPIVDHKTLEKNATDEKYPRASGDCPFGNPP